MTDNNLHGSKLQNDRADAGFAAQSGAQIAGAARQVSSDIRNPATGDIENPATTVTLMPRPGPV
jgi:hypothetical protein